MWRWDEEDLQLSTSLHRRRKTLPERRARLQKALSRLCRDEVVVVKMNPVGPGSTTIEIKSTARIRKQDLYFDLREEFVDVDVSPTLYAFQYCLRASSDPESPALFRYECHPDSADAAFPDGADDEAAGEARSSYGLSPHFHPHHSLEYPISRLHYPFRRLHRGAIVFSLIAWIEIDIIRRYYAA